VVNYSQRGRGPPRRTTPHLERPRSIVPADVTRPDHPPRLPAVQAYLLGTLDLDAALALQRRLTYDVSGDPDTAAVILCDHPPGISIGREGSRAHVRINPRQLTARRWNVRWVARGGGVVLHTPGQVACYPILPLERLGLTASAYLDGLCGVVADLLAGFGVNANADPTAPAVRVNGRRVAHFGAAVRGGVTSFGFVLNVAPDLELFRDIDCDGDPVPVTSIQRECPTRVRVQAVRQRLLDLLALRFGFGRVSLFHNNPVFHPRVPSYALPARHR
jgi:lipoyl(octanoyl) transferase